MLHTNTYLTGHTQTIGLIGIGTRTRSNWSLGRATRQAPLDASERPTATSPVLSALES